MIKTLNKAIILLIIIVLITPYQLIAQRTRTTVDVVTQARSDAEADAEKDVNAILWLGCGCVPIWGLGAAYLMVPSPKPERLIGKSTEYIQTYTEVYKSKRRAEQTKYAAIGCAISGVIILINGLVAALSEGGCIDKIHEGNCVETLDIDNPNIEVYPSPLTD